MGLYLLVCLAFVICALVEFAIAIILHRRKEWKNRSDLIGNQTSQERSKKNIAKNQVDTRAWAELRTNGPNVPSTDTIDFMSIWIYLVIFFLFNCIYWNSY